MSGGSTKAVYVAIVANTLVMFAKFGGWLVSGSPAMLSEGIHSLADIGNQALLAIGIRKSGAAATDAHPYGFHRDRYIWALISAVGIFFLGCGVTTYHGFHALLYPTPTEGSILVPIGVLVLSVLIEGWSLVVALQAASATRGEQGWIRWLLDTEDPMAAAVVLEDFAAVTGVVLAFLGIGLTSLTGDPRWDALSSILIGLLLGVIAIVLVQRNRALLIGEAPKGDVVARLRAVLDAAPEVEHIAQSKSVILGSGAIRYMAEVDFDGRVIARNALEGVDLKELHARLRTPEELSAWLEEFGETVVNELAAVVDRIEKSASEAVPELEHVDIEAD